MEREFLPSYPTWFNLLPPNCRPWKKEIISELQDILNEIRFDTSGFFSDEAFSIAVGNSFATSKRVQIYEYYFLLGRHPDEEKKELLKSVLISRIESARFSIEVFNDPAVKMVYSNLNLDEAMKEINSLKDLCDFIGEREKFAEYLVLPDLFRLREFRMRIDETLNREIESFFSGNLCPRFQRMDITLNPINGIKFSMKVYDYFRNIDPNIPTWTAIQSIVQAQFPQISTDTAYLIAHKYLIPPEYRLDIDRFCQFLYWRIGVKEYERKKFITDKEVRDLLNKR